MRSHLLLLLLAAASACATAGASPPAAADLVTAVSAARAGGPPELDALLAAYDALPAGPARDALGLAIDRVAGQRYATTSRLYWYTDLAAAEAEAHRRGAPILSLRMLGRLDEDLSCANSRFFRTTLYANAEVSRFLRDHFVLYWSSERAVPIVTIDFGDGRRIERTTTGNSAHYVLDERGRVLDVLPGLWAPSAFQAELAADLPLAEVARAAGADDAAVGAAVLAHAQHVLDLAGAFGASHAMPPRDPAAAAALVLAQRISISKASFERVDLSATGYLDPLAVTAVARTWESLGAQYLGAPVQLDAPSRALVLQLYDAVPPALRPTPAQRDAMLVRLADAIAGDTAQNALQVRPLIAQHLVATGGRQAFAALNAWIYDEAFHTPRGDAWLGLLPRTDFSGLPGDGVVTR